MLEALDAAEEELQQAPPPLPQRTLEAAGRPMTATACLETPATYHVNRYESSSALSRRMGLLVEDAEVAERLELRGS